MSINTSSTVKSCFIRKKWLFYQWDVITTNIYLRSLTYFCSAFYNVFHRIWFVASNWFEFIYILSPCHEGLHPKSKHIFIFVHFSKWWEYFTITFIESSNKPVQNISYVNYWTSSEKWFFFLGATRPPFLILIRSPRAIIQHFPLITLNRRKVPSKRRRSHNELPSHLRGCASRRIPILALQVRHRCGRASSSTDFYINRSRHRLFFPLFYLNCALMDGVAKNSPVQQPELVILPQFFSWFLLVYFFHESFHFDDVLPRRLCLEEWFHFYISMYLWNVFDKWFHK